MRAQIAVFVTLLTLVVVNGLALRGDALANTLDNAMQMITGLTAVILGLIAARRHTGRQRAWRLVVALGMAGWSSGQAIWSWYQWTHGGSLASPSWADFGYLSFPVFVLPALFVAARGTVDTREEPSQRTSGAKFALGLTLDGLIVTASVLIMAWSAALGPAVRTKPNDLGDWVAILYPVTDLLMVVVALLLLALERVDLSVRRGFVFLTMGIIGLACSDTIYAYLVSIGALSMKPWADAGFVLGPLLIAFAMLSPVSQAREAAEPRPQGLTTWQFGLPLGCLVLVGLLVTFQLILDGQLGLFETFLAMVVVSLVVARQFTVLLDNRLLIRKVYDGQRLLAHQAYHDQLTGLANRRLFTERLDAAIASRRAVAVIFVDLDDFKSVNDQFGHTAGDGLLLAIGQRLTGSVRRQDTVARIGGDEFAILIDGDPEPPATLTGRITTALRSPFAVLSSCITMHASMGMVLPDLDEPMLTADVLLRRADQSMYEGKQKGKNTSVVFASAPSDEDFSAALRSASGGVPLRFNLYYQPMARLSDGKTVALEALARWTTPGGKPVAPSIFVPTVEASGLGLIFDTMVLDLACREITEAGCSYPVHVNIGPARLCDPDFEAAVAATTARYGITDDSLILEVTETTPIADLSEAAGSIRRLQSIGVRVALDDFGTGYNSLMYLHALPVDLIKLDRTLTEWFNPDDDGLLYRSVMKLCMTLGFGIVAEGIETAEQAARIRRAGCSLAQGNYFGQPAPLAMIPQGSQPGPVSA
jgi:diguanylate cyclase